MAHSSSRTFTGLLGSVTIGVAGNKKTGSPFLVSCLQVSLIVAVSYFMRMVSYPSIYNLRWAVIKQRIGWADDDWDHDDGHAVVRGFQPLFLVPLLVYMLYLPTVKSVGSDQHPEAARAELEQQTARPTTIISSYPLYFVRPGVFTLGMMLKVNEPFLALLIMYIPRVNWKESLAKAVSWDTLFWSVSLVGIAWCLNKNYILPRFSRYVYEYATIAMFLSRWQCVVCLLLGYAVSSFIVKGVTLLTVMFPALSMFGTYVGNTPSVFAISLCFVCESVGSEPMAYGIGFTPITYIFGRIFVSSVVRGFIWLGIVYLWWIAIRLCKYMIMKRF